MRGQAAAAGLLSALALLVGAAAAPPKPLDVPVDVTIPKPPTAFRAAGKTHLVYELHVTNFGRQRLRLVRVEAPRGRGQVRMKTWDGMPSR